jgi:hypothetical protein
VLRGGAITPKRAHGERVGSVPFGFAVDADGVHGSERVINETAQTQQAPAEQEAGAAVYCYLAALDSFEGEHRRVELVAQLVGESPEALRSLILDRTLA